MIAMLKNIGKEGLSDYTHRTYVVSQGDSFSARWARDFEKEVMRVTSSGSTKETTNSGLKDKEQRVDTEKNGNEGGITDS
jgi:hypothetical protein